MSASVLEGDLGFAPRSGASLCTELESYGSTCTYKTKNLLHLATLRGLDSYDHEDRAYVGCHEFAISIPCVSLKLHNRENRNATQTLSR